MSRRLVVPALAALGALAVAGAVLASTLGGPGPAPTDVGSTARPAVTTPGATTSPDPVRATAQDVEGPVLLVPGYGGQTGGLEALARALRATGRTATIVALPGDGTGDLALSVTALEAAVIEAAVIEAAGPEAAGPSEAGPTATAGSVPVDVVGYSAGGVVARLWAKEHPSQVRRVVTLGAPHHGTDLAAFGAALAPGACPAACRQLVPGSPLLQDLAVGGETPAGPQWMALWTTQDQTVTPPESARLEGAVNVALQSLCPGLTVDHARLPSDPTVIRVVLGALSGPSLAAPSPTDCR